MNVNDESAADRLSNIFAALADPTRRAILARLQEGETPVGVLAEPFDISLPAISRHLKVLERAGLIARGREAQWRPCRLDAGPIKDVAAWADGYRRFVKLALAHPRHTGGDSNKWARSQLQPAINFAVEWIYDWYHPGLRWWKRKCTAGRIR